MADVYWNGSVNNTWDAAGNWEDFATAPYGSIPLHGDDVHFLGARLGANRVAVGPTAIVLLESIYADLAYDNAVNADVCYANCGMAGRPVATVTIDGDSYIAGGIIETARLNHSAAGLAQSARVTGGTIETLYCTGDYTRIRAGGAVTTAYFDGDFGGAWGVCAVTTAYVNGDSVQFSWATGQPTVTTTYINGDSAFISRGTLTTVYAYGDTAEFYPTVDSLTTLYIYGDLCEVSLIGIAAGDYTNGPYMCGLDQVLLDYDTGFVIADLSQIPSYSEGRW